MQHDVVLIPGDGIGPEVCQAVKRVLAAAGAEINWIERHAGVAAVDRGSETVLPRETVDAIKEHGTALKGPCTTPIGGGFSSVNVALRKRLNLYGAVRPVRSLYGVETRFADVDIVVVRENTEGLYSGIENAITDGVVTSLKVATEEACDRIARFAFHYARTRERKKVTAFHKANIMKLSDGLFLKCAQRVHENEFPEIEYEEHIIDAGCMRLVQDPTRYDILLCENLYGDVVSDLCSGLVGGLGVTPGANFGDEQAVFEAVHGSAPDIAGQDVANPLALLASAVLMLRHLAETTGDAELLEARLRIRSAYNEALEAGREDARSGRLARNARLRRCTVQEGRGQGLRVRLGNTSDFNPMNESTSIKAWRVEFRAMVRLAAPVIVVQLGLMSFGVVDTMMLGHYEKDALAAAGLGHIFSMAILLAAFGILLGLEPLIAQAWGAERHDAVASHFRRGIVAASVMTVLTTIPMWLSAPILEALRQDDSLIEPATRYIRIVSLGNAGFMFTNVLRITLQQMSRMGPLLKPRSSATWSMRSAIGSSSGASSGFRSSVSTDPRP